MERLYLKPALCRAIQEYCELNDIEDINNFANRCALQGFNIVKYGLSPVDNIKRENNGIKDLKKNESRKKRDSESGLSEKQKQSRDEKDLGSEEKGKQEKEHPSRFVGNSEEESKPAEGKKSVTVRKIRIIKKDKND